MIPDGIDTLSTNAFYHFSGMTSLTIPDGVKEFSYGLRDHGYSDLDGLACPNLTKIKVGKGLSDTHQVMVYQCDQLSDVQIASASIIRFDTCKGLKELKVPDGVMHLILRSCENLTTLILGKGHEMLEISSCKELLDVYNPAVTPLVTNYNTYPNTNVSFSEDCLIEYVTLHVPESALDAYKTTAPWSNFGTIVALKEGDPGYDDAKPEGDKIVFADQLAEQICIEHWDTDGDGKLSLAEAAAVTDLGTTFQGTKIRSFNELKYFTGLTVIADNAFNSCNLLEAISLPDGIKSIGSSAFYYCASLPSVNLPDGVTELGSEVFKACYKFTSLNLPRSVSKIPSGAYSYCRSLPDILEIPDHITEIGGGAFGGGISFKKVYIPSSVKVLSSIFYDSWTTISSYAEEIHVDDINTWLNITFDNSGLWWKHTPFHLFVNGSEVTEVVVPDGITKIGDYQFANLESITSITIPNSVTTIGEYNQEIKGETNVEIIPVIA